MWIRRWTLGAPRSLNRLYTSRGAAPKDIKKETQPWLQLSRSFVVPEVSAEKKVEIAPRLQPRFPPGQTVYESSDFTLAKRKYEATARSIAAYEGLTRHDRFAKLNANPLELWKSPTALSEFITSNGKIMPSWVLGNKGKTQKKLAKAVRRCRAAGLLSTVHRSVFDST